MYSRFCGSWSRDTERLMAEPPVDPGTFRAVAAEAVIAVMRSVRIDMDQLASVSGVEWLELHHIVCGCAMATAASEENIGQTRRRDRHHPGLPCRRPERAPPRPVPAELPYEPR